MGREQHQLVVKNGSPDGRYELDHDRQSKGRGVRRCSGSSRSIFQLVLLRPFLKDVQSPATVKREDQPYLDTDCTRCERPGVERHRLAARVGAHPLLDHQPFWEAGWYEYEYSLASEWLAR